MTLTEKYRDGEAEEVHLLAISGGDRDVILYKYWD